MSTSTSTLKKPPISIVPAPALRQKQTPPIDRLDAMDMVNSRHLQVQAILASIFMSLDSTDPTQGTVKNAIWGAQDLLEQAQGAVAMLELCGSDSESK
jgi:hypothetical protein